MRVPLGSAVVALLLGACVAPPPQVGYGAGYGAPAYRAAPAYRPAQGVADPYCREERREASAAQRAANQEAREAQVYGGRRQGYEAAAAQVEADRQRMQARRAC